MVHTRLLLTCGLFLGLVFAGVATRSGDALILAIPFGLYLIVSWYLGPQNIHLEARRTLSAERIALGGEVNVVLELTNKGRPIQNLHAEEILPEGISVVDGESSSTCSLNPGESIELEYKITGQRGAYRIAGVRIVASETFNLFRKREILPIASRLLVLPQVKKLRRMELRTHQTRIYSGQVPARIGGPGVEFHGIRPYQHGDPTRWINRRLMARNRDSLYVNEFEQERVADVGLILDARLLSNMPSDEISLLEHSVEAAAALSDFLLDGGNRVGLLIYGGPMNWTFPGYGKLQKERILHALANADHGSNPIFEDLSYIPTRLFPLRTQLILFSPILEDDLPFLVRLRARGYQIILVSPDPVTVELRNPSQSESLELAVQLAKLERDLALRQLNQAGVRVINWDVEVPFQKIADQVLSRPHVGQHVSVGVGR